MPLPQSQPEKQCRAHKKSLRPPVDTKVSHMPNTSSIGIHGTTSKPHWNSSNVPPQMVALVQGMHPTSGMSINQMTLAMPHNLGLALIRV